MKPGQRTHCALWLVAAAALVTQAMPRPAQTQPERGILSVLFENDYFFHTDRDYTNGVAIAWTSPPIDTPYWPVKLARELPFFAGNGEVRESYSLGQNIYTPSDLHLVDPPPTARPYAGWLYLAMV